MGIPGGHNGTTGQNRDKKRPVLKKSCVPFVSVFRKKKVETPFLLVRWYEVLVMPSLSEYFSNGIDIAEPRQCGRHDKMPFTLFVPVGQQEHSAAKAVFQASGAYMFLWSIVPAPCNRQPSPNRRRFLPTVMPPIHWKRRVSHQGLCRRQLCAVPPFCAFVLVYHRCPMCRSSSSRILSLSSAAWTLDWRCAAHTR